MSSPVRVKKRSRRSRRRSRRRSGRRLSGRKSPKMGMQRIVIRKKSPDKNAKITRKSPNKRPVRIKKPVETKNETDDTRDEWIVYTMNGCPYCENAKELLIKHKKNPKIIVGAGVASVEKELAKKAPGFKTWPKIFKNGVLIGGYMDLKDILEK